MALDGSGISRPPRRRNRELSLDELPRLGFLPLIFCNKLKMKDVVSTTRSSPE
jgi:hypothetical protein